MLPYSIGTTQGAFNNRTKPNNHLDVSATVKLLSI